MPLVSRAESSDTFLPTILAHISPHSLVSLEQDVNKTIHPDTMSWYPINFVVFLFSLWVVALVLHDYLLPSEFILGADRWKACSKNRRTMIVYLLSILVTLFAFALQVASCGVFRFHFTTTSIDMIRTAAALVSALYLFEIIYREQMRVAMLCHHILTMFASSFILYLLDKTQDPSFIITGSLWLFQATTEQLTFVALYGYRLEWHPKLLGPMLKIAAVQSLLVKMASVAGCIAMWILYQKDSGVSGTTTVSSYYQAWDAIFWLAAIGLMTTQFWGSWVVWVMGSTLQARYDEKREKSRRLEGVMSVHQHQQNQEQLQRSTFGLELQDVRTLAASSRTPSFKSHYNDDKASSSDAQYLPRLEHVGALAF